MQCVITIAVGCMSAQMVHESFLPLSRVCPGSRAVGVPKQERMSQGSAAEDASTIHSVSGHCHSSDGAVRPSDADTWSVKSDDIPGPPVRPVLSYDPSCPHGVGRPVL
jgi:hypothetical protein